MSELESQILFWESTLDEFRFLMSPATEALIKGTINSLKALQNLKRGEK